MRFTGFSENPFVVKLCFHKIIEKVEKIAADKNDPYAGTAVSLLKELEPFPELRDGITELAQIERNTDLISRLLADLFPDALQDNEIKAVSIPYLGLTFNYTRRFNNILNEAGASFDLGIRDFDEHQFYIRSSCIILNRYYGTNLEFGKPLFYDIPTAKGVINHYRILYNADFLEVIPTDNAIELTQEDINLLMDNYDNLALWKEKFPPGSWIVKGFGILNLYDATVENAVSILKSNLLGPSDTENIQTSFGPIFRSIFKIAELHVGFTTFDKDNDKFISTTFSDKVKSYLLENDNECNCDNILLSDSYKNLVKDHKYFAVSNLETFDAQYPENKLAKRFLSQNISSFILAPVVKDGSLLGILELVSKKPGNLNSVNAEKLDIVMPFIIDTISREFANQQNSIRAVIQKNYTTLHASVYWKFRQEAVRYLQCKDLGYTYDVNEIVFNDVYPLYGQVDIKNSSITRNLGVQNDLSEQLQQLIELLKQLQQGSYIIIAEEIVKDLKVFVDTLKIDIKADTEQSIQHYLEENIHPLLTEAGKKNEAVAKNITAYFKQIDKVEGAFFHNRRNYESTLKTINEKVVNILDDRQAEIQQYFPHYYERFKTDGVEHNMYIGTSISPNQNFIYGDLQRLRLWQLLVTAEMEIEQYMLKESLPVKLGVTSLVLVFSVPIAIRFRMDEKHFDIDGAYNIRYEVIKKRLDKAFIKGTTERITQEGKITIIYSKTEEEAEYKDYLQILQSEGLVSSNIDFFDVEDLQGVSGLKAMRVAVLYNQKNPFKLSSYDKFYRLLNAQPVYES